MARILLLVLPIGICPVSLLAQPQPRSHGHEAKAAGLDIKVLDSLDVFMQRHSGRVVSGVVAIIGRLEKIGYFEAFGLRVLETKKPMTKDTLFRVASMTKPITAVAAMTLWEEGKFKLDDPIAKHLPEWKGRMVKEGGRLVAAKTPITPRHLLTHSSGIATYDDKGLKLTREMTSSQFSKALAKQPLHFQPGSKFLYGYSIDILGRYLEAIEGKPFDRIIRERVLDKLGMKDTDFWVKKAADRDRIAHIYTRDENGELTTWLGSKRLMNKPARMKGGGGLVSTARDYAKFCQMLLNNGQLNGKRVLKKRTVGLMLQNHLAKSAGKKYGLGANIANGRFSHAGAYGTLFWINPKNNSFGVFMSQRIGYRALTGFIFRTQADKALARKKKVVEPPNAK